MPHHSHLALARSRQDDFLRDAERHRLAAAARRGGPGLPARLAALIRRRPARYRDAPGTATPAAG